MTSGMMGHCKHAVGREKHTKLLFTFYSEMRILFDQNAAMVVLFFSISFIWCKIKINERF